MKSMNLFNLYFVFSNLIFGTKVKLSKTCVDNNFNIVEYTLLAYLVSCISEKF